MIDRKSLLTRHNPLYREINKDAPLSVGNGKFCFTADFTGLQTFFDEYSAADDAFPLCTMAEWGWHSCPSCPDDEANLRLTPFDTWGRQVGYAKDEAGQEELFKRLRQNAHKFHLGKVAFEFEGKKLSLGDTRPLCQMLSLWEGNITSEFTCKGETVKTKTFVHPDEDTLYIRAESPLLKEGKLGLSVVFPYGSHKKTGADFSATSSHKTKTESGSSLSRNGILSVLREMDGTVYGVSFDGRGFSAELKAESHTVVIRPNAEILEISVRFEPLGIPSFETIGGFPAVPKRGAPDSFDEALAKCENFWERYWNSGGAVDFSGSKDSRAAELERRVVLSQYLIAIQSRGLLPPAETGHTINSWYGKFHLEMHYWHSAQFALWGRPDELKKSLEYYKRILPRAREIAASQGYTGARWPKMCDPSGKNTPSSVAVLLIWQQPHPIMLAELYFASTGDEKFLRDYRDVIVESAEFMKSFLHFDNGRYVLGPPYIPAQERHDPKIVMNAAFELEYFRWGLGAADNWLKRLGEKERYGEILEKMSLPAVKDGVYLAHENCPDTFTKLPFYTDHPSMLGMLGILDSEKVDREIMSATLDKVLAAWNKPTFYGWDCPMMAMTACRLGRRGDAIDMLLMETPKNTFMPNGHNRMTGNNALPLYLPGNGGLLIVVAMMAAGFGGKKGSFFPEGFNVKAEGLNAYI